MMCKVTEMAAAFLHFVALCVLVVSLTHGASVPTRRNKLIVVIMSGMRHDYLNQSNLRTFSAFQEKGFYASKLTVPMIPNSWPSLWSLATGLYPEEHGILDNDMFDSNIGVRFSRSQNDSRWYEKEPLWITAENQGIKTAVAGYPGGTIAFRRVTATHTWPFSEDPDTQILNERIRNVVAKLAEDVDLAFIMLPEPDNAAHRNGVNTNETRVAVEENDAHLQELVFQLNDQQLTDKTNVIIVGDHGMTDHETNMTIYLNDCVALADLDFYTGNMFTTGMIQPKEDVDQNQMYSELLTCHQRLTVYKKEDIPEEYHMKNSHRMTPFLVVPDEGWRVQMLRPHSDYTTDPPKTYGMHGYLNTLDSMKSIFLAKGPDFKTGSTDNYNSINLYPLMCSLLNITCSPTPGQIEISQQMINRPLVDERPPYVAPAVIPIAVRSGKISDGSSAVAQAILLPSFLFTLVTFSFLL